MSLSLEDVRIESLRYGPIAYIATVSPQGEPHLAPVAVSWFEGSVYAFVLSASMKVRNARYNPRATVHFAVGPTTNWDSCIVWGEVFLVETTAEREKLWDKMGYDLTAFEPGGPESDNHLFFQIKPSRATVLRAYGIGGRDTWKNASGVEP